MSDLIAVAYRDEATARDVLATLGLLTDERTVTLADAVIVTRSLDGKVKLRQSVSPAAAGATGGALWGGLIGLLFLAPLLGMAVGAAAGAGAGALTDVGVDNAFMKDLGQRLQPGGAAVIVLVRDVTPDKVLPELGRFGGEVVHSSLSDDAEAQLQAALEARETAAV